MLGGKRELLPSPWTGYATGHMQHKLSSFPLSVTNLYHHMPFTYSSISTLIIIIVIIVVVTTKLLTIQLVSIILINTQQPVTYIIVHNCIFYHTGRKYNCLYFITYGGCDLLELSNNEHGQQDMTLTTLRLSRG